MTAVSCSLCLEVFKNTKPIQLGEKINDTHSIKDAIKYQFTNFEVIKSHPVDF